MKGGYRLLLDDIVNILNDEFDIKSYGEDPAFSRFIPYVYDPLTFDWRSEFEKAFTRYFNGLMIKGTDKVHTVFLAVFPTRSVLDRFIDESQEGDLLFMHHPLLMECGDPKGEWGRGFVPIKDTFINKLKEKNVSVYTCHLPMDYHPQLGTNAAIVKALEVNVTDGFLSDHKGNHLVLIGDIPKTNTKRLIKTLEDIFEIPYVDFEGKTLDAIKKVAIVAGCGDKVDWMKEAERRGVQAYITGEVHCHIDSEYGRQKYDEMKAYASVTTMSLIGVSHAASEYLVKETLIKDWLEHKFSLQTVLLPQEKWWL